VEHRPAPHDGCVLLHEEADRHDLHAIGFERDDLALRRDRRQGRTEPVHARDRVAPDIGVEHTDALALAGQRCRQVGGQGRLADAALARADADHVGDLRERALGKRPGAAELLLQGRLLLVAEDVEEDVDVGDALQLRDRVGHGCLEVALDRTARRRQRDGHVHDPVRARLDRAHHVQLDDRAVQLRVDHDL